MYSISCVAGLSCFAAMALGQVRVDAQWQVSTDNGSSWQSGVVAVAQSQSSVLVRVATTTFDGASQVPSGSGPHFCVAVIEPGSTSALPNADAIADVRAFSSLTQSLLPFAFAQRRVGSLLFADNQFDTLPPGQGQGISCINTSGGVATASRVNPLAILQYQLQLDGSAGDRLLAGEFVPFGYGAGNTTPAGSVLTGVGVGTIVTPVTQFPTTLVVVPTPASATIVVGVVVACGRRRRGHCVDARCE